MSKTSSATGTCLCGAVIVSASQVPDRYGACHCGMCRKWGGGPFMALNCRQEVEIKGEENVRVYDSSPWAERGFCRTCGTHLFYRVKEGQQYYVPVGLLADSIAPAFGIQVFIDRKPDSYAFANETKKMTEAQIYEMYASKD